MNNNFWMNTSSWTYKSVERETISIPLCLFPYKITRNDGSEIIIYRGIKDGIKYFKITFEDGTVVKVHDQ